MAFYPLPANRRELLWELTSQVPGSNNSIEGMKTLVLADRICEVLRSANSVNYPVLMRSRKR